MSTLTRLRITNRMWDLVWKYFRIRPHGFEREYRNRWEGFMEELMGLEQTMVKESEDSFVRLRRLFEEEKAK